MLATLIGGAVGIFLAPIIAPAIARMTRPTAKAAIKAGWAIYERGRETAAELREAIEDATAEVNMEMAAEKAGQSTEPVPRPTADSIPRTAVH